jgi:hypothetical protein
MAYATAIELMAEIGQENADDDTLDRLLSAAERKINNTCLRPDGFLADTEASARYYKGSGTPVQRVHEFTELSAVAVKGSSSDDEDDYTSWTVGIIGTTTEADVFPARGDAEYPDFTLPSVCGYPFDLLVIGSNGDYNQFTDGSRVSSRGWRSDDRIKRGLPTVEVTAYWGFAATVPPDIKEATIMQAARWYKRLRSGMADSLASTDLGQLLYTLKLDPDIASILLDGRYVRPAL